MNRRVFLASLPAAGLVSCGQKTETAPVPPPDDRLALDWKPEPEFGGFYAAPYKKYGLSVKVLPGGSGSPTAQMIGAGSAEFGIVSADELVVARSRGNELIALFAVFQNCPQGIMVHASRYLLSLAQVFGEGTVAMEQGLPYARILQKKYNLHRVRIVPSPGGDISAFLHDEKFAQQVFVTSEPLAAKKAGVNVTVFPISDSGYNPYTTVLACSSSFLQKNAGKVQSMVMAVREGWQQYLNSPDATNVTMHGLNPSMDAETFAAVAEAQKPWIVTKEPLGSMTEARWETLIGQLKDLGDITEPVRAEQCFRNL